MAPGDICITLRINRTRSAKPDIKSFYEAVARTLQDAEQILLFGNGTGASSAMEQLLAALKRDHKPLVHRVLGCVVVDEPHLSEDQLLAQGGDSTKTCGRRRGPDRTCEPVERRACARQRST